MTKELLGITGKRAISAFEKAGFRVLCQKEAIVCFINNGMSLLVIPVHSKPLRVCLLKKEIKKAGLTVERFKELL